MTTSELDPQQSTQYVDHANLHIGYSIASTYHAHGMPLLGDELFKAIIIPLKKSDYRALGLTQELHFDSSLRKPWHEILAEWHRQRIVASTNKGINYRDELINWSRDIFSQHPDLSQMGIHPPLNPYEKPQSIIDLAENNTTERLSSIDDELNTTGNPANIILSKFKDILRSIREYINPNEENWRKIEEERIREREAIENRVRQEVENDPRFDIFRKQKQDENIFNEYIRPLADRISLEYRLIDQIDYAQYIKKHPHIFGDPIEIGVYASIVLDSTQGDKTDALFYEWLGHRLARVNQDTTFEESLREFFDTTMARKINYMISTKPEWINKPDTEPSPLIVISDSHNTKREPSSMPSHFPARNPTTTDHAIDR